MTVLSGNFFASVSSISASVFVIFSAVLLCVLFLFCFSGKSLLIILQRPRKFTYSVLGPLYT